MARSTFRSQMSEGFGALLEVEMLQKCALLWCKAHFQVKTLKPPHAQTTFEGSDVVLRGRREGFCILPTMSKTWGLVAVPKTMSVGHSKRICKDACGVASAVQETCSSEMLGGQGADFLREVAFWSIRSSGLLR